VSAPAQKITFAEMRASGVRGLLIYCSDYQCSHWTAISGDRWRMMLGFPTSSRASPAKPAARGARMYGQTSIGSGRTGRGMRPGVRLSNLKYLRFRGELSVSRFCSLGWTRPQ
jgi:hypothetical protein